MKVITGRRDGRCTTLSITLSRSVKPREHSPSQGPWTFRIQRYPSRSLVRHLRLATQFVALGGVNSQRDRFARSAPSAWRLSLPDFSRDALSRTDALAHHQHRRDARTPWVAQCHRHTMRATAS